MINVDIISHDSVFL